MRLIKLICLLSIIMPLTLAEGDCRGFIQQLASQRNNLNFPYKQYFASSGIHGVFDLGNKTNCELDAQMKYFVLVYIIPGPPQQTKGWHQQENGICVPQYCTKEILSNDQGLLKQMSSINSWNAPQLVLHDPNETPQREPLYYALINFFYVLVGLCVISTIVQAVTKTAENHFSKGTTKKNYSLWLFKSFDLFGNLKSLWMTAEESGQSDHIATFGFLRILAIIWIMAFHADARNGETFRSRAASTHPEIDRFILTGDLAPGYFFFMGGFLALYTVANKASKDTGSGLIGFFSDILHRFFKIYPGVCVAILCYWVVTPGLFNGTLWGRYHGVVQVCAERWQNKFLMIDNFKDIPIQFDWCASWTWYMDVDFQIYPLIVFIGYVAIQSKCFKYFAYIGMIVLAYLSVDHGLELIHNAERTGLSPYWAWYANPFARAFEVLIGAFFGLQYFEYAKLKLKSNFVAWCESFGDLRYISVVAGAYINYYCVYTPWNESGWSSNEWHYIKRIYTGIGTGLFLMPLANDAPSVIKALMNLRIFQILGKLCFGAYLLHWPLQLMINYRTEKILDRYDSDYLLYKIKLNILHSFAAAFVYYLVLEKPLLNIESHFTKRQKPAAIQAETAAPSIQYKVLSELPDQDQDVTMAEQYSVMDSSTMRAESPIYPDNKSVRSMRSTKSTRSTRQVGDSISIVHDVEMGKFDHYEDIELEKSRHIALSRNPSSPTQQ